MSAAFKTRFLSSFENGDKQEAKKDLSSTRIEKDIYPSISICFSKSFCFEKIIRQFQQ